MYTAIYLRLDIIRLQSLPSGFLAHRLHSSHSLQTVRLTYPDDSHRSASDYGEMYRVLLTSYISLITPGEPAMIIQPPIQFYVYMVWYIRR